MAITLTVLASLLQLHGPGATIESDHQGIDALLSGVREQSLREQSAQEQSPQEQSFQEQSPQDVLQLGVVSEQPEATQVYFRRGAFARRPYAGGFRGVERSRELLGIWPTLVRRDAIEPHVAIDVETVA